MKKILSWIILLAVSGVSLAQDLAAGQEQQQIIAKEAQMQILSHLTGWTYQVDAPVNSVDTLVFELIIGPNGRAVIGRKFEQWSPAHPSAMDRYFFAAITGVRIPKYMLQGNRSTQMKLGFVMEYCADSYYTDWWLRERRAGRYTSDLPGGLPNTHLEKPYPVTYQTRRGLVTFSGSSKPLPAKALTAIPQYQSSGRYYDSYVRHVYFRAL
ncbi:MAG: hypothetical protein RR066_03260 [Mucinivorans sp.]